MKKSTALAVLTAGSIAVLTAQSQPAMACSTPNCQ
jgi:hypothetical protein